MRAERRRLQPVRCWRPVNGRVSGVVFLALSLLLVSAIGCGPTPPGYTPYFQNVDRSLMGRVHPDSIEVWFSPLSSVKPYHHRSTTGLEIEAPIIDPREFCSPDSVVKRYITARDLDVDPEDLLGLPTTSFQALGELSVPIYVIGMEMAPNKFENTEELGPHKKPYRVLKNVDWAEAFAELRWRASQTGADAVRWCVGCCRSACGILQDLSAPFLNREAPASWPCAGRVSPTGP